MPFTGSHPALMLPFMTQRFRALGLVPAALVIGSMAPDLSGFTPLDMPRSVSHSVLGSVTVVAGQAVLLTLVWVFVLAPPAYDVLPRYMRERIDCPTIGLAAHQWLWLYPSAALGAFSHVVWDSFTHRDGQAVLRWVVMLHQYGRWPLYKWGQYGTGALALLVIALCVAVSLWRSHSYAVASNVHTWQRLVCWFLVLVPPTVMGAVAAGTNFDNRPGWVAVFLKTGMGYGLAAVLAIAVWWWCGRARRSALFRGKSNARRLPSLSDR